MNEAARLIYQINSNLGHKKRGLNIRKNIESSKVLPYRLNSKKFHDDLKKIADLEQLVSSEPLSRDFKLKNRRNWNNQKN